MQKELGAFVFSDEGQDIEIEEKSDDLRIVIVEGSPGPHKHKIAILVQWVGTILNPEYAIIWHLALAIWTVAARWHLPRMHFFFRTDALHHV